MALPQDPSTLSDEQLLAAINGASSEDVDPPTQRQAPTVDFNEVMRGLTSDETRRAESDSKFAQSLIDRHGNFALRTSRGENPLASDTPDAERLWHWQNAYAEKPSLLTVAGEAVKTIAKDTVNALAEVTDIALDTGKAALTFDNDLLTKTGQRAADLATVASAKALSVNNTLVRGAGQLATNVATSGDTPSYARAFLGPVMLAHPKLASVVEKAAADTEGREQLEVEQRRLSFENARANFRDDKTAETFHKDIALIFPGVAAVLGNTEVNQSAASGLANIPQMGVEMVVARGAAVAGYSTASANARLAVESLKKMESELVSATTARSAAVRVGDNVAMSDAENWVRTLDGDIAVRRGKIGELMSKAQAELDDAMTLATSRVAAATVAQGSGRFISGAGKLAEALDALPADLAAKIAPDSQVVRDNLERAIRFSAGATAGAAVGTAVDSTGTGAVVGGIVAGKGFGGVSARAVTNAGRDLTRLGEIFAMGESTLPFWQNVRKARDISGVTKQAAAFMDNSLFDASAQVAVGAVKGGVAAGAVGAGIGALMSPDDVVSGAVGGFAGGAAFGSTVGALGQWKSYENAAQLAQERAGQLRVYKDLLLARPDEAKHFDKLDNFTQTQIAGYLAAHPDLKVRYLDDPTLPAGNYDGKALPDYITINLASRDPLVDIVAHEVSHYVEHHQLGSALVKQALGDFEAGIPGDYSERDAFGNPVLEMDGTGKGVRYKTNSEFNARRDAYVERLKATAQRAGWSPEVTAAEVARVSEPDYIAREIFAEQHVAYLNSPTYARDLKGIRAPSDWVNNSAFLKNALAKFGVVFKPDGEIVRSGILGDYSKSATFDGLMREYYRKRAEAKSGDVEFTGGNTNIDEAALTKATGYVERYFDASGEILRDTEGKPIFDANGKAQLRKQADSDKDARGAAEAAVKQLDSAAGVSPDALPTDPDVTPASSAASPEVVQRRKTADGRTVYAGRYMSDETLAAIVASGKLNPTQLDNLRQLNSELKAGFGAEWTHFYQAATKKGGGSRARSLAGRWRTDLVYGIEITQPGNIIFKSISLEVLNDNAARAVQKGEAKLWNNSIADLLADTRTYLKNVADGVPGETGLGVEKKNFLNNLLGLRIKAHGDVNPLYETTNQPKTIITSLRLDRMNRLSPVAERNVPFSAESYQRAARNLRPDAEGQQSVPENVKTVGDLNKVLERALPEIGVGGEGIFFRAGRLPASGFSINHRDGTIEKGVSVYRTPAPDSLAGMTEREWFTGRGTVVGRGSDGEPLIKPLGTWKKFFDPKIDKVFGNAANKWALDTKLIADESPSTSRGGTASKPNIQMRPDGKVERDIGSNADFAKPPTDEAAVNAISADKRQYFGKARSLPEGTPVGLRIDIPAFERHDVYVVTVHDKATPGDVGDRIGYDTVVRVTDPKFFVKEGDETIKKGAQAIKDGRAKKHPIATVEGAFDPSREIPSDIENWTAVGFDPKDHSYFYDKRTDEPVLSGTQAVSVGNTVFVKDPVYGDKEKQRYRPDSKPAAKSRGVEEVATQLGISELGEGAKKFGHFMHEMNAKGVTPRDVLKAYLITTSSINRQAVPVEKVSKNWTDLSHTEPTLRPEDAFAKLLGTEDGQKFLDAAVAGNFDEASANAMLEKFKSFGLYNTQREYMRNAAENISQVSSAILDAVKDMPADQYADFVRKNFKGIAYGKVGFMSGMLGRGDLPTVDVRERKLWYEGGDVKVDKGVLMQVRDGLKGLGIEMHADLQQYYQTIVHHAVWDKLEGTDTSHGDIKQAMLQFRPDAEQPGSKVPGYTPTANMKNVPEITLADLRGKKVFPIIADLTAVGRYAGIDSAAVVPIDLYGGPSYPFMDPNKKAGVVWANEGKGIGTRKAGMVEKTGGYAVVTAMSQNAHMSNTTTVTAFINTLEAYVRDGRVSPEGVAAADKAIAGLTSEVVQKIRNSDGEYARDRKGEIKTKKVQEPIDLPSVSDPEFAAAVRGLTFDARSAVVGQLERAAFEKHGFPPAKRVLDAVRDPRYHGVDIGDSLLVIKLDPENTLVKLGEDGTPTHPDYTYGVRGQIVGRLKRPIPSKLMFSEFYEARRAAGEDAKDDRYTFSRQFPIAEVTDAKILAAQRLESTVAMNAQQMRAALSAATGSWSTSDKSVKDGGVSPADFARALRENEAAPSLTPYSEAAVKEKVKKKEMRVFKLDDAEIYFSIVKDGDKQVVSSVVNNEPGARGVAGPAVLTKAIQEGATHLDCFAVASEKYPKGFLPELYSAFGFVEDGARVDFAREYFDADWKAAGENPDIKFADLLHFWKSSGWNPSTPKPQVTFMRLHENFTSNDARQNYNRRLLETDSSDLANHRRATRPGGDSVPQPDSAGAGAGGAGGNNAGPDRGVEGDRRGVSAAISRRLDDYRDIVRDLATLTDEDARLRGLDVGKLQKLRALVASP